MMKKLIFRIVVSCMMIVSLMSCRGVREAVAMKDCDYNFSRVGEVSFLGIGKETFAESGGMTKALKALASNSVDMPLNFTVFLNVSNPNGRRAAVEHLDYVISINDVEFAHGATETSFSVDAGQTAEMKLPLTVNVRSLLDGDHARAVRKILFSMIGLDASQTSVKVQIKPTVRCNPSVYKSPVFIPIVFEYGR